MVGLKLLIPKKVRFFLLSALIFAFSASAQTKNVLFLGVFNQKGETIEATLEQAMRHELSTASKFRLISSTETQRYLRELQQFGITPLERLIPPKNRTAYPAIAIWAVVKESSMHIGRHMFFWGKVDASLTLDIFIADFRSGEIYYRGSLEAKTTQVKEFIFVNSARRNVHISAIDRSEIQNRLHSQMVKSANDIFMIVLNSLAARRDDTQEDYPAEPADDSGETEHRIPSVTDIFSEPAVNIDEQPANEEHDSGINEIEPQDTGMEATITVE